MAGTLITDYVQASANTVTFQNSIGQSIFSANTVGLYNASGALVVPTNGVASYVANVFTANVITTSTITAVNTAILTVSNTASQAIGTLANNTTITPDFSQFNNFTLTLGVNATLANATNIVPGQSGTIFIKQDTTGSRTLAYGSIYKWPSSAAPTLTTTANATDILVYTVESTSRIDAVLLTNMG